MARRVLLVDPDLDALGELSAALRGNGFTVLLADNIASGVERAKQDSPDIILASIAVCHPGELTDRLKARPRACESSVARAGDGPEDGVLPPGYARRADLDGLMIKIIGAPLRSVPARSTELSQARGRPSADR